MTRQRHVDVRDDFLTTSQPHTYSRHASTVAGLLLRNDAPLALALALFLHLHRREVRLGHLRLAAGALGHRHLGTDLLSGRRLCRMVLKHEVCCGSRLHGRGHAHGLCKGEG
eukprot:scaffold8123_cov66-Phaeocystis_antarctica.AAC.7